MAVINPYLLLPGSVDVGKSQSEHSYCAAEKHAFKFDDLLALVSDAIAGDGQLECVSSASLLLGPSRRPLDCDHRFISRELCQIQCQRCDELLA